MDTRAWVRSAMLGLIAGMVLGIGWLSPAHEMLVAPVSPRVALAAGCAYVSPAYYTGSATNNVASQLAGISGAVSVRTPTYTCDTTQADTAYWVGITGASGTCPYPQFAQAGWVMLNVPTSFYEEFNANLQPCDSGPIYGSSVSGTPTYQVNARIVGSFYCSSRSMTDFWVNGAGLGSVCSDWQYGKNVQVFAERREDNSRLASMSFTGLKYCTGDNQADCAPGIAYSVQTSASQPEDPCGIYTWLGTSSFSIKDKRDNGVTSC